MADTEFLRSDELPGRTALGYLEIDGACGRTCSTCRCAAAATAGSTPQSADISALWRAFFAGRIVPTDWVREMVRPAQRRRRGRCATASASGCTQSTDVVMLVGSDAGVSFRTVHDPRTGLTHTVVSNTSDGAWPLARYLRDSLGTG